MNESRVLGRIDEHTKYGEYEFERQINHKAKISRKNTLTRAWRENEWMQGGNNRNIHSHLLASEMKY